MANNTGGIPWNRIQLVEKLRTHLGDCGQAAKAPMRLPITKENNATFQLRSINCFLNPFDITYCKESPDF